MQISNPSSNKRQKERGYKIPINIEAGRDAAASLLREIEKTQTQIGSGSKALDQEYRLHLSLKKAEHRWVKEWIDRQGRILAEENRLYRNKVTRWQVERSRELLQPEAIEILDREQDATFGELPWVKKGPD